MLGSRPCIGSRPKIFKSIIHSIHPSFFPTNPFVHSKPGCSPRYATQVGTCQNGWNLGIPLLTSPFLTSPLSESISGARVLLCPFDAPFQVKQQGLLVRVFPAIKLATRHWLRNGRDLTGLRSITCPVPQKLGRVGLAVSFDCCNPLPKLILTKNPKKHVSNICI